MADPNRQLPEDDNPVMMKPGSWQRKIPELRNGALGRRMKGRLAAQQPTPHQAHEAHLSHEANVKNNPNKYR